MSNQRLEHVSRKISEAFARANEQRAKELVKQQEQQAYAQHVQQVIQQLSELTSQVNAITGVDNATTITKTTSANTVTTPDALSADEEQYKQTIVQSMVALIKQRKMK